MLVITEKPDVARQWSRALKAEMKQPYTYVNGDKHITITHCRGHLLEMARAEQYDERMRKWNYESLPVIPGEFRYNVKGERGAHEILKVVNRLIKEAMNNKEEILIATDAGREGEVIARLVLAYAKAEGYEKLSRFWVSESTAEPSVVIRGINERKPLREYDRLAELGIAWKKCDWIFGINMTVLFSLLGRETMNTGRVQTAVLREVYERQKKVEGFVAKPYKELEIKTEDGIVAYLVKPNGEKMFAVDSGYIIEAEKAVIKNKSVLIKELVEKKEITEPPLLYSSSDLQKDAYRLYGFSPSKTLDIMQKLYEDKGVLSYPRTPSRVLGEGNEQLAQGWVKEQLSHETELASLVDVNKYRVTNRRLFNNAKLEDHYGLVPLKYYPPEKGDGYLVWRLVQIRFLMQGMEKYVVNRNDVLLESGGYQFRGTYRHTIQTGWKGIEIRKKEKGDEEGIEILKLLRQGMVEKVVGIKMLEKKTKPPLLYNYGTILAFMQNPRNEDEEKKLMGIGTEATRPSILKGLETHELMKNEKGLTATKKGQRLLAMIKQNPVLEKTIEPGETTAWEEMGRESPKKLLETTAIRVREAVKIMEDKMAIHENETFGKCPACGGDIYEGEKSYYCSNYKDKECKVHLPKLFMGHEFDKAKAREFFTKPETPFMEGIRKDGEKAEFRFVYSEKDRDVVPEFRKNDAGLGKCPKCGKQIYSGPKNYFCAGYKDEIKCNFFLWKETEGATFTPGMITELLAGATLNDVPCFTKEGKEYKSGFRLREDGELIKIVYGGGNRDGGEETA
jgi:DNA topoisomerase-3